MENDDQAPDVGNKNGFNGGGVQHTGAPWHVRSDSYGYKVCYMHWQTPCILARLTQFERPKEEEANARLMATAPELLTALEGVLRVADRATVEFDAARAAIAKVRGQSR